MRSPLFAISKPIVLGGDAEKIIPQQGALDGDGGMPNERRSSTTLFGGEVFLVADVVGHIRATSMNANGCVAAIRSECGAGTAGRSAQQTVRAERGQIAVRDPLPDKPSS